MRSALLNIVGSTAGAQLLMLAAIPLLTRTHDRATFGVYGVATTAALVVSTLLSLKGEYLLPTRSKAELGHFYSACIGLIAGTATVALALAAVIAMSGIVAPPLVLLTLLFAIGHALFIASGVMLNVHGRFRTIAALNLLIPVIFLGGSLLAPLRGPETLLLWQAVAYATAGACATWLNREHLVRTGFGRARRMLLAQRAAITSLVPSQLLVTLSQNVTILGAAFVFDEPEVGLLVVAQRIARAPIMFVGNGLNEVMRSAIPKPDTVRRAFEFVSLLAVATALVALVGILVIPASGYALVVGSGWDGLREALLPTTIAAAFQLLLAAVASVLTSLEQRLELLVNGAAFLAGVLALAWAFLTDASLGSYLWASAGAAACVYLVGYALAWRAVRRVTAPRRAEAP